MYKVLDEDGIAIRVFPNRKEAEAFLQDGWSIVYIKKVKVNPLDLVGECLF
jgi:hypothetical protein